MDTTVVAVGIVVLGLIFDYTNGFHDCANVVSTVIATRVLKPLSAIVLAGVLNTLGATQVSAVASTITSGLVNHQVVTPETILSAIVGAIVWNVITWYYGIPSSSSYSLVGGLIGATWFSVGRGQVLWAGILSKVIYPMIASPFIGCFIAFCLMKVLLFLIRKKKSNSQGKLFSNLQIGSASIVALAHGLNDAQKSMGIITLGLFAAKMISSQQVPFWVIVACALVMGLGTASGGVRIIRTVGFSITKLQPIQGFASELSASLVILIASLLGMPISSTHMIVGSVAGSGAATGWGRVKWSIFQKLGIGWVLTLPGSAALAAFTSFLLDLI
ncbi:MAG: anion permease [Chlamydiae bacterium]|nr:anion permease [Chlamydiota bacterium]